MVTRLGRLWRVERHRYAKPVQYLTLGFVTTIALAWASTWIGSSNQRDLLGNVKEQPPEEDPSFRVTRSFGSELATFELFLGVDFIPWYLKWLPSGDPEELAVVEAPYWTKARCIRGFSQGIWDEGAHGWPFKSLRWWSRVDVDLDTLEPASSWREEEPPPPTVRWGIAVPVSAAKLDSYEGKHILPLNPIWPGLLADTVIFALMWAMVIALPPTLYHMYIRRRRRRRGQCETCGYSLANLPGPACPECGEPLGEDERI